MNIRCLVMKKYTPRVKGRRVFINMSRTIMIANNTLFPFFETLLLGILFSMTVFIFIFNF